MPTTSIAICGLSEFFVNPAEWFYKTGSLAKKLPGLNEHTAQSFHDWLECAITRVVCRSELAPGIRAMLVNEFRKDVGKLSRLLDVGFACWLSEGMTSKQKENTN